jgi:hypothetical protein
MTRIIIDGQRYAINEGGIPEDNQEFSRPFQNDGVQNIIQPSELGESLKELNLDSVDSERLSGIDLRSRLHHIEVSAILAVDTLIAFKFLPMSAVIFTRIKKRLSVSQDGKGREEIVDMVRGKRQGDIDRGTGSFVDKMKSGLGLK